MDYIQEFEKYKEEGWKLIKEDNKFYIFSKAGLKYNLREDFDITYNVYTEFEHELLNEKTEARELWNFLKKLSNKSLEKIILGCENVKA